METPKEFQPPESVQDIDHPLHPGWYVDGLDIMTREETAVALAERFGDFNGNFVSLLFELGNASRRLDSHRHTHEMSSMYKLQLGAMGVSSDELNKYRNFIGQPERVGEYILWFAKVATAAYTNLDHIRAKDPDHFKELASAVGGPNEFDKIGLDLGGKRQAGIWDSTDDLDAMAARIAFKVFEIEPRAIVGNNASVRGGIGYTFLPLDYNPAESHDIDFRSFTMGTVRRRRTESLVRIPGLRELAIIKESYGALILSEMENERDRDIILKEQRNRDIKTNRAENSAQASAAGRAFERAILNRHNTREIVPLCAHYYMLAAVDRGISPV